MRQINSITGLRYLQIVPFSVRTKIKYIEPKNNIAVHEVLKKETVILLTHNELFRDPLHPLIVYKKDCYYLPSQPFPEFSEDAIMSCPSKEVHDLLVKELELSLEAEEATLLIGF